MEERQAFLAYVEEHGRDKHYSVNKACKAVGIRRKDVRALFESDPEFDEDYQTAQGRGAEQILNQMVKLAIEGVEEPIASGGAIVGHKRVYSERLLQTMFNAKTPEGRAMLLGKLGIEINAEINVNAVQAGVSLPAVLAFMRKHVPELEEAQAGEIVDEHDEPA